MKNVSISSRFSLLMRVRKMSRATMGVIGPFTALRLPGETLDREPGLNSNWEIVVPLPLSSSEDHEYCDGGNELDILDWLPKEPDVLDWLLRTDLMSPGLCDADW
jgi:hypothetical protein